MDGHNGPSGGPAGERARGVLPMIKYQIRPRGAIVRWSPTNHHRRCECRHTYAYPNAVIFAVVEERKKLAKDNARLETEVNQLKEANKRQAERIKELEYDVVEGQDRVDDLYARLGEARERMVKRARKVRVRAESILNLCNDLLEEESDEASYIGGGVGGEPAQFGRSTSPTAD
nr:uncharacterized protein LOC113707384 [Coffea arabica]